MKVIIRRQFKVKTLYTFSYVKILNYLKLKICYQCVHSSSFHTQMFLFQN